MSTLLLALLYVFSAGPQSAREKPPRTYSIPVPPKPDFSGIDWLLGEWTGKTIGRSPQGEIHFSVEFALDKRFMILREEITLAATQDSPARRESWMGILSGSRSAKEFLLRTYSSTGFINRYGMTVDGSTIQFNPEGGEEPPPGWLFRRTIQRSSDTEFSETVQVAPPNRPFFDYYTAKFTRVAHP